MCECQPNGMICNKKTGAERDLTIFVELWWSIVLRYVDAPSPPQSVLLELSVKLVRLSKI